MPPKLSWDEKLHYRDRLRAARYAALADAEGFGEICFAIEALGLRLHGKKEDMGKFEKSIRELSADSLIFSDLSKRLPWFFTRFGALYETVRNARNDAMHTGVYARHATSAAIELCIGLEEAIMQANNTSERTVADVMVKTPVSLEPWQPVAYARQLMLMHSFSFLPVLIGGKWKLVSEVSMAKYLNSTNDKKEALASSIKDASERDLQLIEAAVTRPSKHVSDILKNVIVGKGATLWLVVDDQDPQRLVGLLSPFELM